MTEQQREPLVLAAELIVQTAEMMNLSLLSGNPSRNQVAHHDWMHSPKLGDTVVVTFTGKQPAIERVGRWVTSWTYICAEEEGQEGVFSFKERGFYAVHQLELLDGRLFSWTNVGLIRVPANETERRTADVWWKEPVASE